MENNNKPQWLIDAENAINEFGESKYGKMSQKEFVRSRGNFIAGKTTGQKHIESGHIYTLNDVPRKPGQRAKAGKKGGAKNVETGWAKESQVLRSKAGAKVGIEKKESKYPEFLSHLPETGITKQMAKEATVAIGYAERQWDRLLTACCDLENHITLKNGRTNWELSTWKKK